MSLEGVVSVGVRTAGLALSACCRADAVDAALIEARDRAAADRRALAALAAALDAHLPGVAADLEQVGVGEWEGRGGGL